jgi:DNA-directed RNA polymerase specialized sigma24 family protein
VEDERTELRRLMGRLADGDRAVFGRVFALLWPRLRAFALRCAGPADGEDAAQAAVLKVFSRASEYDRERDALVWALGIAAWECRTVRRKRDRRREEPALALAHVPSPMDGTPEDEIIDRDLRAAAAEVLGTLRPLDIETLAAAGQGAARGATFRKRLERALSRFRLAWRARHGDE